MLVYQRRNEFEAKVVSHYIMSTTKECEEDINKLDVEVYKRFRHFYNLLENNKGLPTWMRPKDGYPLKGDLEGYQHAHYFIEDRGGRNEKVHYVVYRIEEEWCVLVGVGLHSILKIVKQRVGAKRVDNRKARKLREREEQNRVQGQLFDFMQNKGIKRTRDNTVEFDINSFSFGGSEALDGFIEETRRN